MRLIESRDFADNHYYGHASIAARYCHLMSPPSSINGLWVHGWIDPILPEVTAAHGITEEDKNRLRLFVWNARELQKARAHGFKRVIPIGSPFIYLSEPGFAKPTGKLLVMPMHSIPTVKLAHCLQDTLPYLQSIRSRFSGVRVCLYYADYPELAPVFEREGYEVLCAGHVHDPQFLYRIKSMLEESEFFYSNNVMTAVWYALYAGCKVFLQRVPYHIPPEALQDDWYKQNPQVVEPTIRGFKGESLQRVFPNLIRGVEAPLQDIDLGRREIGHEFKRSPAELKKLLGWSSSMLLLRRSVHAAQTIRNRAYRVKKKISLMTEEAAP